MVWRNFYPRPPRGGRQRHGPPWQTAFYFYPRPPRGGRLLSGQSGNLVLSISIHALREEGDMTRKLSKNAIAISIHALREEGDRQEKAIASLIENFYPRPPRGGRPSAKNERQRTSNISIHALREEGDAPTATSTTPSMRFLSTPSARRATNLPHSAFGTKVDFYPRPPRGGRR